MWPDTHRRRIGWSPEPTGLSSGSRPGGEVRVRLSADVADPGEYRIKLHRAAGHELYEACFKVPEVRPGVRCPTGVYGYPIREAAEIAIREAKAVLAAYSDLEVTFCCFSAADKAVYESLLK